MGQIRAFFVDTLAELKRTTATTIAVSLVLLGAVVGASLPGIL